MMTAKNVYDVTEIVESYFEAEGISANRDSITASILEWNRATNIEDYETVAALVISGLTPKDVTTDNIKPIVEFYFPTECMEYWIHASEYEDSLRDLAWMEEMYV